MSLEQKSAHILCCYKLDTMGRGRKTATSRIPRPASQARKKTTIPTPPTITLPDETQIWTKEDKAHRIDGPAIIYADGTQEWCREGILHRTSGPARINNSADLTWYINGEEKTFEEWGQITNFTGKVPWDLKEGFAFLQNGILHREDGPAIAIIESIRYSHRCRWYFHGKEMSAQDWGERTKFTGKTGWDGGESFAVWKDGLLHCIDGPAVVDKFDNKKWYFEGKLHRIGGPAEEDASGELAWYQEGIRHREDGPAIEWRRGRPSWYLKGQRYYTKPDWEKALALLRNERSATHKSLPSNFTGKTIREDGCLVHYKDGQLHSTNGAAVIPPKGSPLKREYWLEGKCIPCPEWKRKAAPIKLQELEAEKFSGDIKLPDRSQVHLKDGFLHSEDDKPAVEAKNGEKEWRQEGLLHRDNDKPARTSADGGQEWFQKGLRHRVGDAAIITSEGDETWFKDDLVHRTDGPAMTEIRTYGGGAEYSWYLDNIKMPAEEWAQKTKFSGKTAYSRESSEAYWKNGLLHREDGPALIFGTGKSRWFLDGVGYEDEASFHLELASRRRQGVKTQIGRRKRRSPLAK